MSPRPLREADLSSVRAVLTDVDGTLTTGNTLRSQTLELLWRLRARGIHVVFVSGRPAGWGECWARQMPIAGAIVENGGLYFVADGPWNMRKVYAQPDEERISGRQRLERAIAAVLRAAPGARLSSDTRYTEVDMAIDWNEEAKLPVETARELERRMRAKGFQAVRSSVHVNCWAGDFDKLSTARKFLNDEWGMSARAMNDSVVYVGDSFNDAPMFQAFPLSVGVANVRPLLDEISHPPAFITRHEEGLGFEEVARAVLKQAKVKAPKAKQVRTR